MSHMIHQKARTLERYPSRYPLEDWQVPWTTPLPAYQPVYEDRVVGKSYADPIENLPIDPTDKNAIQFHSENDNGLDRSSSSAKTADFVPSDYDGMYDINPETGLPINPAGRTGVFMRGFLGRFGPNHAADPVVTRWKRDTSGELILDDQDSPILEGILIQRKDNGEMAIPGGMVEPGQNVSATLVAEFAEEALGALNEGQNKDEKMAAARDMFKRLDQTLIYKGYVDDPRNTDNAWMETEVTNFHDETGEVTRDVQLEAGDDAAKVRWFDLYPGEEMTEYLKSKGKKPMFASHQDFIDKVYDLHHEEYEDVEMSVSTDESDVDDL